MGPEIGTCIGIDASVVWMSSSGCAWGSASARSGAWAWHRARGSAENGQVQARIGSKSSRLWP
jgi:hypothetical protein